MIIDARATCPRFPIPPMMDDGEPDAWARARPRQISAVEGVCFHVTAVAGGFGVSSTLLRKHDGDEDAARLARYTEQRHVRTYHWITDHRGGRLIRKLPANVHSYASNGLNRKTIAHAYDAAVDGPFDWDLAVESIVAMVEAERADGVPLRYGYAHAQSSAHRRSDPGELYWRRAVIPAAARVGLELRHEFAVGTGRPIPSAWRKPWADEAEGEVAP